MRQATFIIVILAAAVFMASALELQRKFGDQRDEAHLTPHSHDFNLNGGHFQDSHFNSIHQPQPVVRFSNDEVRTSYATATYKDGMILWHGTAVRFETAAAPVQQNVLRGSAEWNRFRYNPTWFSGLASTSLSHGYMSTEDPDFFLYKLKTNRDLKIALIPHGRYAYSKALDSISDCFLIRRAVAAMLKPMERNFTSPSCIGTCSTNLVFTYSTALIQPSWNNLIGLFKEAGEAVNVYQPTHSIEHVRADLHDDIKPVYGNEDGKLGELSATRKRLWHEIARKLNECVDQRSRNAGLRAACTYRDAVYILYQQNYLIMGAASAIASRVINQSVFCDRVQGWRAPWDQNEFVLCRDALDTRWHQRGFPLEIRNRFRCSALKMCERMKPNAILQLQRRIQPLEDQVRQLENQVRRSRNPAPQLAERYRQLQQELRRLQDELRQLQAANCRDAADRELFKGDSHGDPNVVDYWTTTPPYDTRLGAMGTQFNEAHSDFKAICTQDIPESAVAAPLFVF